MYLDTFYIVNLSENLSKDSFCSLLKNLAFSYFFNRKMSLAFIILTLKSSLVNYWQSLFIVVKKYSKVELVFESY